MVEWYRVRQFLKKKFWGSSLLCTWAGPIIITNFHSPSSTSVNHDMAPDIKFWWHCTWVRTTNRKWLVKIQIWPDICPVIVPARWVFFCCTVLFMHSRRTCCWLARRKELVWSWQTLVLLWRLWTANIITVRESKFKLACSCWYTEGQRGVNCEMGKPCWLGCIIVPPPPGGREGRKREGGRGIRFLSRKGLNLFKGRTLSKRLKQRDFMVKWVW